MIAHILVGGVWLKYQYPGKRGEGEPLYPYLADVPPIVQSTRQESGNAQVVLQLAAFENLGFPLGCEARIYNGSELLFSGVVADMVIADSITLQLEA